MPRKIATHGSLLKARQPKVRDERASASARGYGARWRSKRDAQLRREPLCAVCTEQGRTVAATTADHIVPRRNGGSDVPSNLQSLCQMHHSQKTGRGE